MPLTLFGSSHNIDRYRHFTLHPRNFHVCFLSIKKRHKRREGRATDTSWNRGLLLPGKINCKKASQGTIPSFKALGYRKPDLGNLPG